MDKRQRREKYFSVQLPEGASSPSVRVAGYQALPASDKLFTTIASNTDINTASYLPKSPKRRARVSFASETTPLLPRREPFARLKALRSYIVKFFYRVRGWVLLALFTIALALSVWISCRLVMSEHDSCDGPPYLYVTHKGAKNILKFSRDGCLIASKVLWGNYARSDLRGLVSSSWKGKPVLFVADASDSSQILMFGTCSQLSGMRPLIRTVVSSDSNEAVRHPYSLDVDDYGNILATFQNIDSLLRFSRDSFEPLALPPMLLNTTAKLLHMNKKYKFDEVNLSDFYPGTFLQFGEVGVHEHKTQGIRAVAFVRGSSKRFFSASLRAVNQTESNASSSTIPRKASIWVTNKNLDAALVLDAETGNLEAMLHVADPIGLHVNYQHNLMFIGSKAHKAAAVHAFDLDSMTLVRSYSLLSMKHPTGIVAFGEELVVADQEANSIWSFNITSGRFLRLVVSTDQFENLRTGELEVISFSDC